MAKDTIAELHIEDRLNKLNQKLEAINDHVRELKNAVGKRNCPEDIKLRSVHYETVPRASNRGSTLPYTVFVADVIRQLHDCIHLHNDAG